MQKRKKVNQGHREEYHHFEKLTKQLISVRKSEIDKREAEYQKKKKAAKKRKAA